MDRDEYLTRLRSDIAAFSGLLDEAPLRSKVPATPAWTMRELTEHLALVYLHKIEAMETEQRPDPWPPEPRPADWPANPADLFRRASSRLLDEFVHRDSHEPCWTWYAPDQTVGFWIRRMCLETVVHLDDARSTFGKHVPIDPEVAEDGIDELLAVFLAGDWAGMPGPEDPERPAIVEVAGGRTRWQVTLSTTAVTVQRNPPKVGKSVPRPDLVIAGADETLLLALWGRRVLDPIATGSGFVLADLKRRLAEVTQ